MDEVSQGLKGSGVKTHEYRNLLNTNILRADKGRATQRKEKVGREESEKIHLGTSYFLKVKRSGHQENGELQR